MAKQILFGNDGRQKLTAGMQPLARAVRSPLGPSGKNVVIDKSISGPVSTKDGISVSKEIELPDPFENMGAKILYEVASKTNDNVGDGTTTATVLAQAIVREGMKAVAAGMNPMDLKRGIDQAVGAVVKQIQGRSKKITHMFLAIYGLATSIAVLGHLIAVPLFMLVYILIRREKWWFAVGGAVFMCAFIKIVFNALMNIHFPEPYLYDWLDL